MKATLHVPAIADQTTTHDPFGGGPENWSLPADLASKPAAELTDADLDVIYGDPTYVEWCARLDALADAQQFGR